MSDDVQEVIEKMAKSGTIKQIQGCLTPEQNLAVIQVWEKEGNVSWFEAFSIWFLKSRGRKL